MKKLSAIRELKSFLLLWSSQTVSELGTAMTDYAIVIWVYGQKGTASSVTLLTLCAFMPTILFRFAAGTFVDRGSKKRIMLTADLFAACGSLAVLVLYSGSLLEIWHIYLINILLSLMNSFQVPASFVAASMLVPKKYYTKVGGLQGISGSVVSILAPALGSVLLVFGGLRLVLVCDLASFAVAFLVLLLFIRLPETERKEREDREPFLRSSLDGLRYLRGSSALFRLTLFIAVINFLAKLGGDGMLAPFVLARAGGDQRILGLVQSAESVGILAGSTAMTFLRPAKRKARLIFITCGVIFLGNVILSLTVSPAVWCAANFGTYAVAAVMNAHETAVMRENVPISMQGRVFSAQDTLKNCTIPLGLFLGGVLADYVFEPFMKTESAAQELLSCVFGSGSGSGMAVIFFCVGILGSAVSITRLRKKVYAELDQ